MPHLSKRKLDTKTQRLLIESLTELFSNLKSHEAKTVVSTLLTKTEQLMLAKRVGASLLIHEKSSEAQISEALKLTRFTVYKYALIIDTGDKSSWGFILQKLQKWHEFTTLKEALKRVGTEALKVFSRGMGGKI